MELERWLSSSLAAVPEDTGSTSSIIMGSVPSVPGIQCPLLGTRHTCGAQIDMQVRHPYT